jgi:hypothetical protein
VMLFFCCYMNPHGPRRISRIRRVRGRRQYLLEIGAGTGNKWRGSGRGRDRCHPDSNGTQGWAAAVTIRFRRADRRRRESVRLNGAPDTARPGKLDLIMSLFRPVKILYHARSRLCATCLFFFCEKRIV